MKTAIIAQGRLWYVLGMDHVATARTWRGIPLEWLFNYMAGRSCAERQK